MTAVIVVGNSIDRRGEALSQKTRAVRSWRHFASPLNVQRLQYPFNRLWPFDVAIVAGSGGGACRSSANRRTGGILALGSSKTSFME